MACSIHPFCHKPARLTLTPYPFFTPSPTSHARIQGRGSRGFSTPNIPDTILPSLRHTLSQQMRRLNLVPNLTRPRNEESYFKPDIRRGLFLYFNFIQYLHITGPSQLPSYISNSLSNTYIYRSISAPLIHFSPPSAPARSETAPPPHQPGTASGRAPAFSFFLLSLDL